jgi:uncharacterized membrane protein YoaK (UPF0700 family)
VYLSPSVFLFLLVSLRKQKLLRTRPMCVQLTPPFCFVIGAVVGNSLIKFSGEKAILICPILLSAAFVLMLYKEDDVPEENAEQ